MTKKQIAYNTLAAREKRLRALAEAVRDTHDCTGESEWLGNDGEMHRQFPAEHAQDCLHCMAKWALTGRYPRPES